MTKVSVFGQETENKKGNPIKFVKALEYDGSFFNSTRQPKDFQNVQLLYKGEKFDTILAWNDNGQPTIYLGHWNDGVVE